jgi:hypothetical protein
MNKWQERLRLWSLRRLARTHYARVLRRYFSERPELGVIPSPHYSTLEGRMLWFTLPFSAAGLIQAGDIDLGGQALTLIPCQTALLAGFRLGDMELLLLDKQQAAKPS